MKATIYGKNSCPYCVKAKALLTEKGATLTEYEVGVSPQAATRGQVALALGVDADKITTVPQIMLDEGDGPRYIGGYTDLAKHFGVL